MRGVVTMSTSLPTAMALMSDRVYNLCRSTHTVSSALAKDPTRSPGDVFHSLFPPHFSATSHVQNELRPSTAPHQEAKETSTLVASPEELQKAFECGKWGNTRPSDLFLKIYHDVLCTLNHDPAAGMVSPPLMGSSGVLPLTVMSGCPDIVRHISNVIARADKEVFLATNFWKAGDTSMLITNALRELSRRAGLRGEKVVVKIMYDRGNVRQLYNNHQIVHEAEYTAEAVQLPAPEDIPNVDMQVVNYHRPMLGTFHAKFVVVDRRLAILCSNNIQDIDNFEMMAHFEGPIVDSIYDMALVVWHNAMEPPLPSHNSPAANAGTASLEQKSHQTLFNPDGSIKVYTSSSLHEHVLDPSPQLNGLGKKEAGPQNETRERVPEHTAQDPHYDPDIASEVFRVQSCVSPFGNETRMQAVTRHLNNTLQHDTKGNAPECAAGDEMRPYIPHPVHDPFPMAMVCRQPYGSIDKGDVYTPQNEAWLSALRNATKEVFIQTPDLNADPLVPAILDACRRGIKVTCYLCLGYNDAGELLPMQGGTNEMVSHYMHKTLEPEYKPNLDVHFYVAKDMVKPINAKFKKRSCHIKLMIVDSHIGIQGSGNQDTQSWFHSCEINVMLDSPQVCRTWIDTVRRNQNTHIYGKVREDGIWRDEEGKEAEGSIGYDPGRFSWAKGIVGAVQRVRGAGGF